MHAPPVYMQTAEPSSHSMCRDVGVDCTVELKHAEFSMSSSDRQYRVHPVARPARTNVPFLVTLQRIRFLILKSHKYYMLEGVRACAQRVATLFCKRKASYDKQRKCVKGGRYWQSAEQSFLPQTVPNPASSSANEGQRAGCCALLVTKQLLGYCRSTPNLDLLATQFPEPSFFPHAASLTPQHANNCKMAYDIPAVGHHRLNNKAFIERSRCRQLRGGRAHVFPTSNVFYAQTTMRSQSILHTAQQPTNPKHIINPTT